uniref:FIG001957: putative hydrolase n=1 Tax=uncultured Thiotrichaceae bacterium TaxID=298394 RepID=A0A6S6U8G2_9GAMM|nr:MAG: FIG001957: putative hydrolase [uncultured Thiotrichaceae bacterium]
MNKINLDWNSIDTVFLDMDGTLLDLHYDTHFWTEHLPKRYAEVKGVSDAEAHEVFTKHCNAIEGTLNWYCLDYWDEYLDLDVAVLKHEVADRIAIREGVEEFLNHLRMMEKRSVLLTNAHERIVDLKFGYVEIEHFFDDVITSHSLGLAKEDERFWGALAEQEDFDRERSLFIDDNLHVLRSAQQFGVANLLAIHEPDSQLGPKHTEEFTAIKSYQQLM